jgi:hypothetical protein
MAIVRDSPNSKRRFASASLLDFPPIRHRYLLNTLASRLERDSCQSVTMRWKKAQAVMRKENDLQRAIPLCSRKQLVGPLPRYPLQESLNNENRKCRKIEIEHCHIFLRIPSAFRTVSCFLAAKRLFSTAKKYAIKRI